jgi:TonB family protein
MKPGARKLISDLRSIAVGLFIGGAAAGLGIVMPAPCPAATVEYDRELDRRAQQLKSSLLAEGASVVGEGDVSEVMRVKASPQRYPEMAFLEEVEAQVLLHLVISVKGKIKSSEVAYCTSPLWGFEKQALKAVRTWRFTPPMADGQPVEAHHVVVVNFLLDPPVPDEPPPPGISPRLRAAVRQTCSRIAPGARQPGDREGTKQPELLKKAKPAYPTAARASGIEGWVVMAVAIDTNGKIRDSEVVYSSTPDIGFEKYSLDAVKRTKYQPTVADGEPVEVCTWVSINYLLDRR